MGNKVHFFRQSGGGDAFIATFRTTTANESITLPYSSSGTYSGVIDWGDGTVVNNSFANSSHTYAVAGDYEVTILGDVIDFQFRFFGSQTNKIIEVKQWGNGFILADDSFFGCSNLILNNVLDTPITGSALARVFRECSSITTINNSNNWDVSSATNFSLFFYLANNFNSDISSWDVSNAINFTGFFRQATNFNSDISSWDVSSVTTMNTCFRQATAFNQDISNWDFSGLNNSGSLSQFMRSKSSANYDATYYDNLLIKWSSSPSLGGLQPNIIGTIDMGSIKYTSAGASARASILSNNKAVTITDGGQI